MRFSNIFSGFRLPILILVIGAATLLGCNPDPCEEVVCQNGACLEGSCACDLGYEGEECQTESRRKFLGIWEVGDICRTTAFVYAATIGEGTAADALVIDNLNDQNISVSAMVTNSEIVLPEQTFGLAVLSGTGGIDTLAGVISIEYRIMEDGMPDEVCQATFRLP